MTYITEDQAIESSEPVEMYLFTGPSASYVYKYTSSRTDQTYDSNTYTPLAISRDEIFINDAINPSDLTVSLPTSAQVVQDYFPIPPRSLNLIIYRRHGVSANVISIWNGEVLEFNPRGHVTTIRVAPASARAMQQTIPRLRVQVSCQHKFGDTRCGINIASHTTTPTVSAIGSDAVTITLSSVGTGTLPGGELQSPDGEGRMIKSVSGLDVVVDFPFYDLSVSDTVNLIAGCDRSAETCRDEYSNSINHSGFPFVPAADQRETSLRGNE